MKGTLFKKLTACALALAMVATAIPQGSDLTGLFGGSDITARAESYSGQCGEDAYWSFDDATGKLTITGEGEMVNNPWSSYSSCITSVDIANGITSICSSAFRGCYNLQRVVIPCSVKTIGQEAFENCDLLEQVTISEGVETIGDKAFKGCISLASVTIPSSVRTIGASAFEGCSLRDQVTISEGVETIGKEAFKGCSRLGSVTIPRSVKTIGDNAFDEGTEVIFAGFDSDRLVYTFPEGTTVIGANSISQPYRYSSVVVPSSVTTIAGNAFRDCKYLTSIYMLCDPSQLTWDYTYGNYIHYNSGNMEDMVNVYVPNNYLQSYLMKFKLGKPNIADAYFIGAYNVSVDSNITHGRVSADRPMAAQDETVNFTVTPDVGYIVKHVYVNDTELANNPDGTYSFTMPAGDANVTAEMIPFDAHLYGHSLSLDGDIGVNFYMELGDSVKNSETAKMIFTVPNGSKTETQELFVKDVLDKTATVDGTTYYQFKCKVSAKDMASPIKAQIVDGDTKGTEYTYSVREYAAYVLEHPDAFSEDKYKQRKLLDLVKAMLNYGSAAQEYFGVGGTLANDGLNTGYSDVDKVSAGDINKPYDFDKYDRYLPEGVTFEGVTLSLKSETTLSLYFKSENEMIFVGCDNFETRSNYDADVERTGDYWVFRIRGISAAELDSTIALYFWLPEIRIQSTVCYCPLIYCYNVLNRDEGTPQLKKVCKALYLYNQAANDYFDLTEA